MKTSELIRRLTEIMAEQGDLIVQMSVTSLGPTDLRRTLPIAEISHGSWHVWLRDDEYPQTKETDMTETDQLEIPDHGTKTMEDVRAASIKYSVVSVKLRGKFIVRGIKKWSTIEATRSRMEKYVAICDQAELEWTCHDYFIPYYMEYGSGDIPSRLVAIDGVYVHDAVNLPDGPGRRDSDYGPGRRIEAW